MAHTEVTIEDAQTITGAKSFSSSVNGVCIAGVGGTTLAQAITCAGAAGVIYVPVGASLLNVPANATIPGGVTLRIDQGAQLSIANAVTLTIQGDIDAGPYQIFSYTGTGVVQFGYGIETVRALWFPGADINAQIQNAYNAAPAAPSSTTIIIDAYTGGGCYPATTQAKLGTAQKAVILQGNSSNVGNGEGGTCINFTPTITGSAVAISAISVSGTTVTVTCGSTCTSGWTGGGGASATVVTIRGVTNADYDGVFLVQTVTDGTHFTVSANIGTPAASSGGNVAQAPVAFEIDTTGSGGGGYSSGSGIRDLFITNNACETNNGCGSYAVGLMVGRANGGMHAANMTNVKLAGFGTGFSKINSTNCIVGWGMEWNNPSFAWNNVGAHFGCVSGNENDTFYAGRFAVNGIAIQEHGFGDEISIYGGSMDSNGTCGVRLAPGAILHTTDLHWENFGNTTTHYVCANPASSNSVLDIKGGIAYDDVATSTTDNWFTAGLITVSNLQVQSNGRTLSGGQVFTANTSGTLSNIILMNGTIPWSSLAFGPVFNITGTSNGSVNPMRYGQYPSLGLSEGDTSTSGVIVGTAGAAVFGSDSTDHFVHYNPNNAGDQKLSQAAFVTSAYTNATTTFSTVTNMSWAVKASRNYTLNCRLFLQGSATTAGPKFQLTGPASPTAVALSVGPFDPIAKTTSNVVTAFSTANTTFGTIGALSINYEVLVDAGIVNGANSGTVVLQAAANGAGTLTIQPGSFCIMQ